MRNFDYFVQKIPLQAYQSAKSTFSKHIAIFILEHYVLDQRLDVEEYHFVLCFASPPVATIRGEEYQFKKGSLICLAPGDDIFVHSSPPVACVQYMTVCVLPSFMTNIYRQLGFSDQLRFDSLHSRYSHFLLEALDALIHEVLYEDQASSLLLSSLENYVAIQLIRDAKRIPQPHRQSLLFTKKYFLSSSARLLINTLWNLDIVKPSICWSQRNCPWKTWPDNAALSTVPIFPPHLNS